MKVKYLLFALLAAGAQPSLAAEPTTGLGEIAIEPAAAITLARRQALQRVADALTAEASSETGVNTRDAVEAIKARIKAMKQPSPPAGQPDCADCPNKGAASQHHSASEASAADCIQCVDRPASV